MIRDFLTEQDERVLCEYRRHWINIFAPLFSTVLLLLVILAGFYLLGRYGDRLPAGASTFASLILLIMLIVAVGIALLSVWVYNQNRIYLTNYHIVVVTQNGLFSRKVSQLSLAKIQDVSVNKKGPIAMMLGYGTLTIETAGEEENFEFSPLPDPYSMAKQVMQAHETLTNRLDGVADTGRPTAATQPAPAGQPAPVDEFQLPPEPPASAPQS